MNQENMNKFNLAFQATYPRSGEGRLAGAASPRIRSRASAYSASFYYGNV